jgi:hypothetical protein
MKTQSILLALLVLFLLSFTSCTDTTYIALDDDGNLITVKDIDGVIKDHITLGADSISLQYSYTSSKWRAITYRSDSKSSVNWVQRRNRDGKMDSVAYAFTYKVIPITSLSRRK